ncbi:MAG: CBS domain-containing protein [Candidatus Thiodiazotropha sp.]
MTCNVGKLVSEAVASLDSATDVQSAVRYMAQHNLGSLVVTENGNVSGLFTERDLLVRVVGAGKDPNALTLGDVSTRNLISVRKDELKGLVSITDVAHALADHNPAKNLLVNLVGGVTLVVTLMVIGMLISHIPDVLALMNHSFN